MTNGNWNLEDKHITAMYHGQQVSGLVESSRVRYGGKIQHTLVLDTPCVLTWRTADMLLIDHDEVLETR